MLALSSSGSDRATIRIETVACACYAQSSRYLFRVLLMPEFRVFISSTFRDLREEREHLVKKIFPEIRALCRLRGITFTEVDLRWGLTDDE